MTDEPTPMDTAQGTLPDALLTLTASLAQHTHDTVAGQRMADGWSAGPQGEVSPQQPPCLVSYDALPAAEQGYERQAVLETLKSLVARGYRIVAPDAPAQGPATTPDVGVGPHALEARLAQLQRLQGQPEEFRLLLDLWNTRQAEPSLWQHAPDLYRHLGQRFLMLGAAVQAHEVARAALDHVTPLPDGRTHTPWAEDVALRQIYGLALARTENPAQAQEVLGALRAAGHTDEETLGMLARTWKDLALLAMEEADAALRQHCWREARVLYEEAYQRTGGYWSGINLATLARLGGNDQQARAVAQEVQAQCHAELTRGGDQGPNAYWLWATLGEAALVLGDIRDAGAGHFYRQAHQMAPHDLGSHLTTRRNAYWLLRWAWHADVARLDRWLPLPTVDGVQTT